MSTTRYDLNSRHSLGSTLIVASIQLLVATGADGDTALQLTGAYRNLLRQWAES